MGKPSDSSDSDRYRTWARDHVHRRESPKNADIESGKILPRVEKNKKNSETGGLNEKSDGRGSPPGSAPRTQQHDAQGGSRGIGGGGGDGDHSGGTEANPGKEDQDATSSTSPPSASTAYKSEDAGAGDSTIESNEEPPAKKTIPQRMLAGIPRFFMHFKNAIFHSWVNVLLVFVPIGIVVEAIGLSPGIIFGMNAVAIIPLAGLLAFATEAVASRLGDTLGALLNVSFGNAVELIIFIIALVKNEIEIVQASLLGSILANLLLILGMAFLAGGLRYREQIYNSTVTQMSACLLSLSVISLLLPSAFYASFKTTSGDLAEKQVLKVSRGTSVVLLIVYVLYLLFQLKSHAYMYESTPQEVIDEESHPGVLADMLNSSSSSDDSSSSDSTDSDTSASGSVVAAGKKKIKGVFKHRRQRKSSASTSSATHSSPSSPSVQERSNAFWETPIGSQHASRRPSQLAGLNTDNGAEADNEDNAANGTLIRDFVKANAPTNSSKSPERKKSRKKQSKHRRKKRNQASEEAEPPPPEVDILGGEKVESPAKEQPPKTVGFAQDSQDGQPLEPVSTPGGTSFNMRQFSSLVRPGLPKLLSNNVFVTPPPTQPHLTRQLAPTRSQSSGANLRRTSSLPDRLNKQTSNQNSRSPIISRTDPLPPFQHQRFQHPKQVLRKVADPSYAADSDDEDDEKSKGPEMSRTAAIILLLCTTALVAVCAEFMVDAIPAMIRDSGSISQAFIGLIILPIVGNAAEHVTAVTVAAKNKMDLAIGVAVGSSIQIALFVTPIVVLLGWILHTDMSLYFNLFETISLFVTAFVVNFLVLDGRSNYLEGSLLIAAYVIIALGAFFYPAAKDQSQAGGGA